MKKSLSLLASTAVLFSSYATAAITVDPLNTGATGVDFDAEILFENSPTDIAIGTVTTEGYLRVDAIP
ncbi:MAG: hypothetical protein AAF723_07490, partial [Pseudomonadota bacterium]